VRHDASHLRLTPIDHVHPYVGFSCQATNCRTTCFSHHTSSSSSSTSLSHPPHFSSITVSLARRTQDGRNQPAHDILVRPLILKHPQTRCDALPLCQFRTSDRARSTSISSPVAGASLPYLTSTRRDPPRFIGDFEEIYGIDHQTNMGPTTGTTDDS
jgi:hypothetical protein